MCGAVSPAAMYRLAPLILQLLNLARSSKIYIDYLRVSQACEASEFQKKKGHFLQIQCQVVAF